MTGEVGNFFSLRFFEVKTSISVISLVPLVAKGQRFAVGVNLAWTPCESSMVFWFPTDPLKFLVVPMGGLSGEIEAGASFFFNHPQHCWL